MAFGGGGKLLRIVIGGIDEFRHRIAGVGLCLRDFGGDGPLFTLHHEQFFDQAARDGHERGWTGTMGKLERYVS